MHIWVFPFCYEKNAWKLIPKKEAQCSQRNNINSIFYELLYDDNIDLLRKLLLKLIYIAGND